MITLYKKGGKEFIVFNLSNLLKGKKITVLKHEKHKVIQNLNSNQNVIDLYLLKNTSYCLYFLYSTDKNK